MSRVAESSHLDSTRQVARKNVEGYRLGHVRPVSTKAAAPASSSTTVSSTRTANRRPRVSGGHGATGNEQEQQRDGWWLVPPHVARTRPMARLRGGNRCSCLTVAHYYCAVATMVVVTLAALISQRSDLHALRQSATVPSSKKDQTHRKPRWKVSDPRPTTIATANTTGASAGAGTSPFESVPPPSIPLFQTTTNPALFNRHTCIQAIRARHQTILGPLLQQLPTSQSGGSILLVDPAYHANVGDHMITLGELEFLQRLGINRSQIRQCSYVQAGSYVPPCEALLNATSATLLASESKSPNVALWHGGGNWGDVWKKVQPQRIASFAWLLQGSNHSTVVGMPQSLFYNNPTMAKSDATLLKQSVTKGLGSTASSTGNGGPDNGLMSAKSRVHLAWREYESYEQAQVLYPFVSHLLIPDIAFQLGPYQKLPQPPGSASDMDLVLFLRSDHESVLSQYRNKRAVKQVLTSIPGGERLKFMIVDWADRLELFDSQDPFFTVTSLQLLSMGKVVICDRLHAAILCYLVGVPFVYIDQVTGKISKSLRVAFDSWDGCNDGDVAMWAGAKSFPSAVEIAIKFLGTSAAP